MDEAVICPKCGCAVNTAQKKEKANSISTLLVAELVMQVAAIALLFVDGMYKWWAQDAYTCLNRNASNHSFKWFFNTQLYPTPFLATVLYILMLGTVCLFIFYIIKRDSKLNDIKLTVVPAVSFMLFTALSIWASSPSNPNTGYFTYNNVLRTCGLKLGPLFFVELVLLVAIVAVNIFRYKE